MGLIENLLAGFTEALVSAFVARWIVSHFLSDEKAKIAAFAFVIGGGTVAFNIGFEPTSPDEAIARLVGVFVAMGVSWFSFFKRGAANV